VSTPDIEIPALSGRQIHIVISGLLLVLLLAALDSTIVATALPTIVGEMGGLTHLSWVVTAYLLAQTIVTPLYGKFGDLYGRKRVVQVAIVIFLAGSALCGLARSMGQLVAFRAVQGLGGGGLMVTTQAAVGDVVPPRDRGRYQGIFGAVFGLSSIAGPLIGGYFTTHLTWRWIFYINLPLGVIAILVIASTLPASSRRVKHAVDYAGAALLALALSGVIVVTDLGGAAFPWASPTIIGLSVITVAAVAGFIWAENRAAEPVVPLRLFRNKTFVISILIGLIVGFALFGSVTYLPLFLQVAKGDSPTASGLRMLPMMGGMLVSSIISGQLISRSGRYKLFPIFGTLVMVAGLFMLSRVRSETSLTTTALLMMTLGLGLGMVMQVLVLVAQNSVDYRDLGVATSGATLFRLIGGSVGTAALGAVFAARLHDNLMRTLPQAADTGAGGMGASINPRTIATMPEAVRTLYTAGFTQAMNTIFLIATMIGAFGFLLSLILPEQTLRRAVAARASSVNEEIGEVFPQPGDDEHCADDERLDTGKLALTPAKT
jgi:EmrB/QacA subfamily drug resistance transporter